MTTTYLTSFTKDGQLIDFDLSYNNIDYNGNYPIDKLLIAQNTDDDYRTVVYAQMLSLTSTSDKNVAFSNIRMMTTQGSTPSNQSKCYIVKYNGPDTDLLTYYGGFVYNPSPLLKAYYFTYINNEEPVGNFEVLGEMEYTATYQKNLNPSGAGLAPSSVYMMDFNALEPIEFPISTTKSTYLVIFKLETDDTPNYAVHYTNSVDYNHKNGVAFTDITVDEYRTFTTVENGSYDSTSGVGIYYGTEATQTAILPNKSVLPLVFFGSVTEPPPLCFTEDSICKCIRADSYDNINGYNKENRSAYIMVKYVDEGDFVYSSDVGDYVKIEKIQISYTNKGLIIIPAKSINKNTPYADLKITTDHMVKIDNVEMTANDLKTNYNVYDLDNDECSKFKIYTFATDNGHYVDINGMNVKTFNRYEI